MEQRVRIINKKGEIKYVAEHIASNAKLLKSYGYVKQDLKDKKDEPKNDEETEVRAKYEKLFGKKAGNKKLETLLKEIEEKENAN
jgi:monomeric isocitrate dehydrogenase